MNVIHTHIITSDNVYNVTLCPSVEYQIRNNQLMFYNTSFDSVFLIQGKANVLCRDFVTQLEAGTPSIEDLVKKCFNMNAEDIIVAMYQKRIIE